VTALLHLLVAAAVGAAVQPAPPAAPPAPQPRSAAAQDPARTAGVAERMFDAMVESDTDQGLLLSAHRRNFPEGFRRMRARMLDVMHRRVTGGAAGPGQDAYRTIITEEIDLVTRTVFGDLGRFAGAPAEALRRQQIASLALLRTLAAGGSAGCAGLASTGSLTAPLTGGAPEAVRQVAATWDAFGAAEGRPRRPAPSREDEAALRRALAAGGAPADVAAGLFQGGALRSPAGASCAVQIAAAEALLTLPDEPFARLRAWFIAAR
jgi:hypothetical protein